MNSNSKNSVSTAASLSGPDALHEVNSRLRHRLRELGTSERQIEAVIDEVMTVAQERDGSFSASETPPRR